MHYVPRKQAWMFTGQIREGGTYNMTPNARKLLADALSAKDDLERAEKQTLVAQEREARLRTYIDQKRHALRAHLDDATIDRIL